jgi:predicted MPP superfamily phosphohydrolase
MGTLALAATVIMVFFILLAIYALHIEPYNIMISETHFDFFERGEPLKIVLISDTQTAYDYPEYFRRAIAKINEQDPDIILLAGDIVEGEEKGWEKLDELKNLKSNFGTYAVLGNHDYHDWDCANPQNYKYADNVEKKLESFGIDVLRNENRILNISGREFAIAGIDDQWACRSDPEKAMANLSGGIPKILLVHEQEVAYNLSENGKTIAFAGHTHCGQFYFPFITDFLTEYLGFGKIRQGRTTLQNGIETYVTCGITPGGIRLFARPEISVIYLD